MSISTTDALLFVIVLELAILILEHSSYGNLRDRFMYWLRTRK